MRYEKGVTKKEMAEICGFTKTNLTLYEQDKCNPGVVILEAMADYFGVTMDHLWKGK